MLNIFVAAMLYTLSDPTLLFCAVLLLLCPYLYSLIISLNSLKKTVWMHGDDNQYVFILTRVVFARTAII